MPRPASFAHAVRSVVLLGLLAAEAMGCQRARSKEAAPLEPSATEVAALHAALATYATIAYAAYSDAVEGARGLESNVERLVAAPSESALADAREAWLRARRPYQQTETYRFYDGPIDRVEMRINTWPIDEAYVDGTAQSGRLGIIDDVRSYPELSGALLASLNAKEGETSVSTGYHVIEFLLWGADTRADGPGARPATDFARNGDPRAERRGRYLRLATELLVHDLSVVRDAWAPGRDNYRANFLGLPPLDGLGLALKGMGALSGPELGGERLTVAYETKAQENEHSCFSDNTVSDLSDDALGIENVCLGRYERAGLPPVHGAGICDAVAARDRRLAERLRADIRASVASVRAIPAPFDRAILGDDAAPGRRAVHEAIDALGKQTSTLAEIAAAYDLRLAPVAARKRP